MYVLFWDSEIKKKCWEEDIHEVTMRQIPLFLLKSVKQIRGEGILKEEGKSEVLKVGSRDSNDNTNNNESGRDADEGSVVLGMDAKSVGCSGTIESRLCLW